MLCCVSTWPHRSSIMMPNCNPRGWPFDWKQVTTSGHLITQAGVLEPKRTKVNNQMAHSTIGGPGGEELQKNGTLPVDLTFLDCHRVKEYSSLMTLWLTSSLSRKEQSLSALMHFQLQVKPNNNCSWLIHFTEIHFLWLSISLLCLGQSSTPSSIRWPRQLSGQ